MGNKRAKRETSRLLKVNLQTSSRLKIFEYFYSFMKGIFFIFNCKINGCKPCFDNFFYKFKFTLAVEKHISVTDSNIRKRKVTYKLCSMLLNFVVFASPH